MQPVDRVFQIVPARTAMLFFDTLNGYLHPPAAHPDHARELEVVIAALVRINRVCRRTGIRVFYSQPDHRPDGADVAPTIADRGYDGRPGDPPRVVNRPSVAAGTSDVEIIPELKPEPEDYLIRKHRWSAFHQTHLELSLRTAGIDTLMIAGGSTEIGVASTAYGARDRDFNVILLRDACRSRGAGVNEQLMDWVFPIFARVMTIDEAVQAIEPAAAAGRSRR
jgi:nicotinamidase-related amidase